MKQTKIIMGMPITIELADEAEEAVIESLFNYFHEVDRRFSPYKKSSELTKVNQGLKNDRYSREMKQVLNLCAETKAITQGYFDINFNGKIDPSGLVKGWAIQNAAQLLHDQHINNFYIEAGGDIALSGHNLQNNPWSVGIRNPFNIKEIIKALTLTDKGVATSGTYIRGQHIYNPLNQKNPEGIASLTIIGPNIFEADRFATAAYAMGAKAGLSFIAALPGFEAYLITPDSRAVFTEGFAAYVA